MKNVKGGTSSGPVNLKLLDVVVEISVVILLRIR